LFVPDVFHLEAISSVHLFRFVFTNTYTTQHAFNIFKPKY